MWDEQALARTLDRKENEAAIFSMLMKNSKKCDLIAEIIGCICNDIIFCHEILTNNHSNYPTKPITFEAYTSRLSEIELFDEDYLDSIRVDCADTAKENSSLQTKIDELVEKNDKAQKNLESLTADNNTLKETISVLKDELNAIRERNNELSLDLDYAKSEMKANDDGQIKNDSYVAVQEPSVDDDNSSVDAEESPNVAEESVDIEETIKETDSSEKEDEPVKEKVLEQLPEDPYSFTEVDKAAARKVRAMKESKMDYFIDMSLTGKHVKACDDIVEFLKVDVKLCEIIESIELGNNISLDKSLNEMLSIVNLDFKSPYQHFYVRSLNPQEKLCETIFNGLMEKTQRIMMVRLGE